MAVRLAQVKAIANNDTSLRIVEDKPKKNYILLNPNVRGNKSARILVKELVTESELLISTYVSRNEDYEAVRKQVQEQVGPIAANLRLVSGETQLGISRTHVEIRVPLATEESKLIESIELVAGFIRRFDEIYQSATLSEKERLKLYFSSNLINDPVVENRRDKKDRNDNKKKKSDEGNKNNKPEKKSA